MTHVQHIARTMTGTLFAAGLVLAALAAPALAEGTTVKAELWDKGSDMEMATDRGYGMAGAASSDTVMGITLSADSAPAGEITFEATNASKDTVHEMIVAPLPDGGKPLPYIADEESVDEDAAGAIGEVSELDPGQSGKVTLHLKAGDYLLFCDIPGHYAAGMWVTFTVK